tara:strand:- start:255 stop:602 length:348 start_codon:yes stop_codon:yes gene_type:complete
MKEKTLLKLSIIGSLIGLIILFLLAENIEIGEKQIDKVTMTDIEQSVKVTGMVTKVTDREKVMFLQVSEKAKIDALLFKKGNISVEKGDLVEINGKVDEYEGKPQIIINEIKFVD